MSDCALLVVGGGPAGHSAAVAYRSAGGNGRVVVLAGEGRAPYQRPPLSKDLLRGETEPDQLPLADGRAFYDDHGIAVRFDRALALRPGRHDVVLAGGETITYTNCVLATGAAPLRLPIPGAELDGVHVLRTVADAMALRTAAAPGARVLVLGSGFIGCEAAASLAARGCVVTLVSQEPLHVEHWGDALAQGEAAGTTAAGGDGRWTTVPGFWSTIGMRTLKHAAWSDGFATARLVDHDDGAFTAWYGDEAGRCVGVLTHARDADYDAGRRLIEQGAPRP
jgi:3-phenylpropionate/trans-cinnamate dioxygenase ferredoxin reductase subunit